MVSIQPSRLLPRWWLLAGLLLVSTVLGAVALGPVCGGVWRNLVDSYQSYPRF